MIPRADRIVRFAAAAVATATLCGGAFSARAQASPPPVADAAPAGAQHARSRGPLHARLTARIDAALTAAGATDAQRTIIHAARDRAAATLAQLRQARRAELERGLQLFSAENLDPAAVTELRVERDQRAAKAQAAIEQAIVVAHDTLTPTERQALVSYLEAHRGDSQGRARGTNPRLARRLNALVDTAGASPEQRAAIEAAVQNVTDLMRQGLQRHAGTGLSQTLAVFQSDNLDATTLAKLRTARQAQQEQVEDAMVEALRTLHDTLTPAQRAAVVAHLRERMARHRG